MLIACRLVYPCEVNSGKRCCKGGASEYGLLFPYLGRIWDPFILISILINTFKFIYLNIQDSEIVKLYPMLNYYENI